MNLIQYDKVKVITKRSNYYGKTAYITEKKVLKGGFHTNTNGFVPLEYVYKLKFDDWRYPLNFYEHEIQFIERPNNYEI